MSSRARKEMTWATKVEAAATRAEEAAARVEAAAEKADLEDSVAAVGEVPAAAPVPGASKPHQQVPYR